MKYISLLGDLNSSATTFCGIKVCKELALRGHTVYAISVGQHNRKDISRENNYIIYEIQPRFFYRMIFFLDKSKVSRWCANILRSINKVIVQVYSFVSIKPWLGREKLYIKKVTDVIDEYGKPDFIVALVQPVESLAAAKSLSNKFDIPYVAYMLDAIYGNNGVRLVPDKLYKKRALNYENKYLCDARRIFMVESVKDIYNNLDPTKYLYIKKIQYVGIPLLIPVKYEHNNVRELFKNDEISILFMGTMPRRIRNPHFALSLMDNIATGNIHFYIIGRSDYMNEINGCVSRNKNIHFLGYVSHDKISQYLQEADVLLNIGNSFANMIPSKVFEYMSYNKPIISTTKILNDPCERYLKQYGNALVINETSSLLESQDKVVRFIQEAHKIDGRTKEITKELMKYTPAYFCDKMEA